MARNLCLTRNKLDCLWVKASRDEIQQKLVTRNKTFDNTSLITPLTFGGVGLLP
ncbi:hypothetical protein RUM43_005717, partial [Polyplax serrata]